MSIIFPPVKYVLLVLPFVREFPCLTSGCLTLSTTPIQRRATLIMMDLRLNLLNCLSCPETDTTTDVRGGGPGGQGSEVPLLLPRVSRTFSAHFRPEGKGRVVLWAREWSCSINMLSLHAARIACTWSGRRWLTSWWWTTRPRSSQRARTGCSAVAVMPWSPPSHFMQPTLKEFLGEDTLTL